MLPSMVVFEPVLTITSLPASATPLIILPVASKVAVGWTGLVLSGALIVFISETFPAASLAVILISSKFNNAVVNVAVYLPVASTVTALRTELAAFFTKTTAPASEVPLITFPVASIIAVGCVGAILSGAITTIAGEIFPAISFDDTVKTSLSINEVVNVIE